MTGQVTAALAEEETAIQDVGRRDAGDLVLSAGPMSSPHECNRTGQTGAAADPPWEDARIPAGSAYSWQEWQSAMTTGDGSRVVFEIRNGTQSALICLDDNPALNAFESVLFDGCLLLSPQAHTTHPQAVSGELRLLNPSLERTYLIVRPECHRADRGHLFGMRGWLRFDPDGSEDEMDSAESTEVCDDVAASRAHAPKG